MEKRRVHLYPDRRRLRQIHALKRRRTDGVHTVFDTERNAKHHADVFWSQALALHTAVDAAVVTEDSIKVLGRSVFTGSPSKFRSKLRQFHKEMP
jgi:mannose/cellobiose epimerase-like protein (N-acyl-D-glucosamine 2-epimerase family)